jgi:hypothetical protein
MFSIDTLGMQMLTTVGQGQGYNFIPVSYYGIVSSTTADITSVLNSTAIPDAKNKGCALYWPPGQYIYSGPIVNTVPWFGQDPTLVQLIKNTTNSKGAAITNTGLTGISIQGIGFSSSNTPGNAINDATNADMMLAFYNCIQVYCANLAFYNSYGVNIYQENTNTGRLVNCRAYNCYKDGFPVDRFSFDVELINCLVENGGDDAFPVVNYVGDPGRLYNVSHLGCVVRGVKFANGFKYAGSRGCRNVGCSVDGIIPPQYGATTVQQSTSAMNILVDTAANTFGNEDLLIQNFTAINCGRGAAPFPSVAHAVQVFGASGKTTRNIFLDGVTVKNSASLGIAVEGGVPGGVENLSMTNINVIDTSDPNGYTGTAGAGKFAGVSIRNASNIKFKGSVSDTGGSGVILDPTCTGFHEYEVDSYRINKGSATGAVRIFDTGGTTQNAYRISLKLHVCEQVQAVSGQQYFIANPVFFQARGIWELLQVEYDEDVPPNNFIFGALLTAQAVGASPWQYQNTSGAKQLVQIQLGTASSVSVARGNAAPGGSPNFGTGTSLSGTLYWPLVLAPGEYTQLTYTALGSLVFSVGPAEGL